MTLLFARFVAFLKSIPTVVYAADAEEAADYARLGVKFDDGTVDYFPSAEVKNT